MIDRVRAVEYAIAFIMGIPPRVKSTMKRLGLAKVNVPKLTPKHSTKSHLVMANYKEGDRNV